MSWNPDALNQLLVSLLAEKGPFYNLIEIGSANGEGTTAALVHGLLTWAPGARLFCLEAVPPLFQQLSHRYAHQPQVVCLPYFSVDPLTFPTPEQIQHFMQTTRTVLRNYGVNRVLEWLAQEQATYTQYAQGVSGVAHIRQTYAVQHFDLALLDGGEFCGAADLDAVYGARLIIMDDTRAFKNHAPFLRLEQDPAYRLIALDPHWRHGYAAFERVSVPNGR